MKQPTGLAELAAYLHELPEPRIVLDADYAILAANKAYERDFGGGQPVIGRRCYEVSHGIGVPCDRAGESCPLKVSSQSGHPHRVLHLHHTARGEEHVDVETTPIPGGGGRPRLFVEAMRIVRQASGRPAAQGMVGRSPAFLGMLHQIMRVAPSEAVVLLLGETGTGKELIAHALHEASARAGGPFVAVDCSGLTETLFESELFGYEKGAFTGASHRKTGLVEAARGGTLFLDEIGELPPSLQVKLLRLLETGSYRRVGGVEALAADFRLVAATHRDLARMVRQGEFRRDLYYRINTFPIHSPSLAERSEDIPLLAKSLLERVAGPRKRISPAAVEALRGRIYEGNIRELRNLLERASLLADGDEIEPEHLADDLSQRPPLAPPGDDAGSFSLGAPIPLDDLQARYVAWAAGQSRDRKTLAKTLGVSERTLYRLLRRSE
ncbi:MAG TPA: sigma 54-interacting transcriptional regulator [Rhodocyclaceae bacterium]|nr:sigma 54-interacting transcriptional regulator [Rhodocyclaceae bacterium]